VEALPFQTHRSTGTEHLVVANTSPSVAARLTFYHAVGDQQSSMHHDVILACDLQETPDTPPTLQNHLSQTAKKQSAESQLYDTSPLS
jgi:hypothetical protein